MLELQLAVHRPWIALLALVLVDGPFPQTRLTRRQARSHVRRSPLRVPSSQASPASWTPFPHSWVDLQSWLHRSGISLPASSFSPSTILPSSHASPPSTMPLPQPPMSTHTGWSAAHCCPSLRRMPNYSQKLVFVSKTQELP